MTPSQKAARPPIQMIDNEADTLASLALRVAERNPQVAQMLLDEIDRATIVEAAQIPSNIVTMQAHVEFIDEASGAQREIRLVFPGEADISAGRISILTPVGAGLIGLREGQSILWPDRDGRERSLIIVKVVQPVQ